VYQFPVHWNGAGGVGEKGQFVEAALGFDAGHPGELDAHEKSALNPDLEVGDSRGETAAAT
jgi:hypothetical protein